MGVLVGGRPRRMVLHIVGRPRNWRHRVSLDLPVTSGLSRRIETMERLGQIQLPNLRRGTPLRVASDYAGQDPRLTYRVLSFVITDRLSLLQWREARGQIRRRYLRHNEHLSFKGLRSKAKLRALAPF